MAKGVERLRIILQRPSTLNLSLATLAAAHHGVDPTPWADMLADRQAEDGSFGGGRVDRTALRLSRFDSCVRECLHLQDRYHGRRTKR